MFCSDIKRYTATAVDLTATGSTVLVPVQARKWVTTSIKIHYKTVTALTVVASASFGSNSTAFDNLQAIAVVGANTAVADTIVDLTSGLLSKAVDCTTNGLTMKVTTGAVATAASADVDVMGYWTEP